MAGGFFGRFVPFVAPISNDSDNCTVKVIYLCSLNCLFCTDCQKHKPKRSDVLKQTAEQRRGSAR